MIDDIEQIRLKTKNKIENINNLKDFEDFKVSIFGKKGKLTDLMKNLSILPKEERPSFGQTVNILRDELENIFFLKQQSLKQSLIKEAFEKETIDVTISKKNHHLGTKHPLITVMDEIKNIFLGMGYQIVEGPDIETSYYNFDALNIPKVHPARDGQDTFYIGTDFLLRSQTSPVQVRTMERGELPIKIIAPGRVYRPDEIDATHSPIFHQIEGLVVDKGINMSNLKGALLSFVREFFGKDVKIRLRPHHFPFTEPSAEMDISCFSCINNDPSCKVCRGEGYIELLGCGMVHPNVLKMSGINPNVYSGFAFGMGLERIAMQKYNIEDLRLFYENDIRFLKQF